MEKEDGGGDELSVGGRQSGLKSTEKKEVIRKEAKREREKERGPQRSRRLGQPPGQAARAGSAFAAQKSLWLRLKLRFLLLLPVVITEVTSPLLLFILNSILLSVDYLPKYLLRRPSKALPCLASSQKTLKMR